MINARGSCRAPLLLGLFFTAPLLVARPAASQEAAALPPAGSPTVFTADEAVVVAVLNDPRLSAARYDADAARFGVRAARALTGPLIAFVPGITSLGGTGEEVLVQQPLEVNGTRAARGAVATAQLRGADARTILTFQDVVFRARTAYYELVRARSLQQVAEDALKAAEDVDRIMRRQVELGSRPGIEATQTGIEVARARQQAALAASQEEAARAALNALLGRATDAEIGTPPPSLGGKEPPAGKADSREDAAQVVREALAKRPEILLARTNRTVFEGEAALARAQGRPDLAPQFRAGSVLRGFRDYGIGLAVSLPFVDYGARQSRIRQTEASARAETERIAAVERMVRQEVVQALSRERAALKAVSAYEGGILEQSRRLLEASRTGFEAGQTGILALLEAQRTFRTVQTEYTNALATLAQARTERDRATGTVPRDLQGPGTTRITK